GAGVVVLVWLHVTNGAALDRVAPGGDGAALLDQWFDKSKLPLPRLVAVGIVFGFGWTLTSECWVPLSRGLGGLLQPLGARALYALRARPCSGGGGGSPGPGGGGRRAPGGGGRGGARGGGGGPPRRGRRSSMRGSRPPASACSGSGRVFVSPRAWSRRWASRH